MEDFLEAKWKKIINGDTMVLSIYQDSYPSSPREDDNLWTFRCWSREYNLSDNYEYNLSDGYQIDSGKKTPDEFKEFMEDKFGNDCFAQSDEVLIVPIFIYEHSGICLSYRNDVYPFNDRWDSGQCGWAYVTREKAKEWQGETEDWKKDAIEHLKGELSTFNQFLAGEVYGYTLCKTKICHECGHTSYEEIDSCWGYYSIEDIYRDNNIEGNNPEADGWEAVCYEE